MSHFHAMNEKLTVSLILAAGVAVAVIVASPFLGTPQLAVNTALAQVTDSNATDQFQNQTMMPPGPIINLTNGTIVLRGTVSSLGDPFDPSFNAVDLLPPSMDGTIYSGTITFAASKRVLVGIYQPYEVTDSSMIDPTFGEPFNFPIDEENHKISISVIEPQYGEFAAPSATISFVGSGLTIATLDTQPFVITYAISASAWKPQVYNDVSSATLSSNMTSEPEPEPENPVSIVVNATILGMLGDQAYSPSPLTVRVGETVTWTNDDFAQHTVTSGTGISDPNTGDEFESYMLSQGGTFEHTFNEAGEFEYYCQIHPLMKGEVIVR